MGASGYRWLCWVVAGLTALARARLTDLDWLREHTRLLARAMEWDGAGRQANRMLGGGDIAAAKTWAARRPREAPEPTELHLAFIHASEQAELERRLRRLPGWSPQRTPQYSSPRSRESLPGTPRLGNP